MNREAEHRAEVGDDVEKAEEQADGDAVVEADEGESDGVEDSLAEGDDELAAKERDQDVHELFDEVQQVLARVGLQERQVLLEAVLGERRRHQEEPEIDREHEPPEGPGDAPERARRGGDRGAHHVGERLPEGRSLLGEELLGASREAVALPELLNLRPVRLRELAHVLVDLGRLPGRARRSGRRAARRRTRRRRPGAGGSSGRRVPTEAAGGSFIRPWKKR